MLIFIRRTDHPTDHPTDQPTTMEDLGSYTPKVF